MKKPTRVGLFMPMFGLVNGEEMDAQNYKQMGGRSESDTCWLSERPRNSWQLHGQRVETKRNKAKVNNMGCKQSTSQQKPPLL